MVATVDQRPDSILMRAAEQQLREQRRNAGDEGAVLIAPAVADALAEALGTASVLAEAREVEAAEASMRAECYLAPAFHPAVARLAKVGELLAPPVEPPPF